MGKSKSWLLFQDACENVEWPRELLHCGFYNSPQHTSNSDGLSTIFTTPSFAQSSPLRLTNPGWRSWQVQLVPLLI
jgi:hypothetical protein